MSLIEMKNVVKIYKLKINSSKKFGYIRSLVHPEYIYKRAVDGISLNIDYGEIVGYIGQNGAGKSTTLKMLSGILLPTNGQIFVNGSEPYRNRKKNASQIGVVFGQRSQLLWDLPVCETFDLYRSMYKIDFKTYESNKDYYVDMLDMQSFFYQPARQLSLGQKMRANIALALIHNPQILYLDEPTIGLDVLVKDKVRKALRQVNHDRGISIILTTHDVNDIEKICKRIIMIDQGKKIFDGSVGSFKSGYNEKFIVRVIFKNEETDITDSRFILIDDKGIEKYYEVSKSVLSQSEAISFITQNYFIQDIRMEEISIEEILKNIYQNSNKYIRY